jgi:asparagine synthase (glutamine-hydrolysing)
VQALEGFEPNMCGIVGIYAYHSVADSIDRAELIRIRDHMAARGPDGLGAWFSQNGRVGLGHRRLSIIDLSDRAAQPMESADGKIIVTFNGEIYNYRLLRTKLEAEGRIFCTESDTEVLLHLYAAKGAAMVEHLRGMFAFGIWDEEKGGLLLGRDHFGIKPLYFANDGRTLRFASQVKALIAGRRVSRDPEAAGWVGFHIFGSVPEPFTIYRDIRAVPAGSTVWIDARGAHEATKYFCIAETYRHAEIRQSNLPPLDHHDLVRSALIDSVRHHMVADIPVGIFLSAGIDSGALLGLMRDVGSCEIPAVTLSYDEYKNKHEDEGPLAAKIARQYGSNHTIRIVNEQEFGQDLPRIFAAMDQPTIDGINTWFVSKAACELGLKAVVSGLGGDEFFGGYPSFRDIPRWARMWRLPSRIPLLGEFFRYFADVSGLASVVNPKIGALIKYGGSFAGAYLLRRGLFMPWELRDLMDKGVAAEGLRRLRPVRHITAALDPMPRTNFARVASLESSLYMRNQLLRDADWASMAHGLEVRLPLVDAHLLRAIAPSLLSMPEERRKRCLATSPQKALPPEIVNRRKTGFGTPVQSWLQHDARLQRWRAVPQLARGNCPWARRWAYQLAAA